jgi:hypothetical protein
LSQTDGHRFYLNPLFGVILLGDDKNPVFSYNVSCSVSYVFELIQRVSAGKEVVITHSCPFRISKEDVLNHHWLKSKSLAVIV